MTLLDEFKNDSAENITFIVLHEGSGGAVSRTLTFWSPTEKFKPTAELPVRLVESLLFFLYFFHRVYYNV